MDSSAREGKSVAAGYSKSIGAVIPEAPKKKSVAGLPSRSDGSPVIARCVPWSEGRYEVKSASECRDQQHAQPGTDVLTL